MCHMAYGAYNGVASSKVSRYTYADNQVTTGTALSIASQSTSSTGNKTFALIRTGINDGNTNRFDYATDTRITGVNLTSIVGTYSSGSQTGNGTIGLMKGGVNSGTTSVNKIQLAANVCTLGTALAGPSNGGGKGMAGTVNVGIFALNGGAGAQGGLYYYPSDVTMMSAATFTGSPGPGVCGNPQGVNV